MTSCFKYGIIVKSSVDDKLNTEGFPSGQRGQTVNLLHLASMVRIHLPPPEKTLVLWTGVFQLNKFLRTLWNVHEYMEIYLILQKRLNALSPKNLLTYSLCGSIIKLIKLNNIFRAGWKSLPAVQPASRKADLVQFQSRQ